MPVSNYKLQIEQNSKDAISAEDLAIKIFAFIEAAEEQADKSPYSFKIKLDALQKIKRVCEEVIETQIVQSCD